jgi:hypothetical protein
MLSHKQLNLNILSIRLIFLYLNFNQIHFVDNLRNSILKNRRNPV